MWQEENKLPRRARRRKKKRNPKRSRGEKEIVLTKETDPWGTVSSHP